MNRLRRATSASAKVLVVALAVYGAAWLIQAEEILQKQCEARMSLVARDSMAAEKAGEWLVAAHGYAHLVAYGQTTESGCRSPEMSGGAWQLPLWTPILRLRFPRPTEHSGADQWAVAYALNLDRAADEIVNPRTAKSVPAASSSHDPTRH